MARTCCARNHFTRMKTMHVRYRNDILSVQIQIENCLQIEQKHTCYYRRVWPFFVNNGRIVYLFFFSCKPPIVRDSTFGPWGTDLVGKKTSDKMKTNRLKTNDKRSQTK